MGTATSLKDAAGWWVLGVVIGVLSGDAVGALAGFWPLFMAASLGGALGALVAAAVFWKGQAEVDAKAFRAQEELIGELADEIARLQEDAWSILDREKASLSTHLPGLGRIQ